ncbi:MAG: MoaD/ThiS family protein [Gallionella sp.]
MIKVLFFGPVVARIGINTLQVAFRPGMRVQDLRDDLAQQYASAFEIVCFVAVDGNHLRDLSLRLTDNSEVTFMAKFSGG